MGGRRTRVSWKEICAGGARGRSECVVRERVEGRARTGGGGGEHGGREGENQGYDQG